MSQSNKKIVEEAINKLNKYRNKYYNDISGTEEHEIANALNILLPEYNKLQKGVWESNRSEEKVNIAETEAETKFDYDVFSDDDQSAAIFNYDGWSLEEAIKQARVELELDKHSAIVYFVSYIEHGFYTTFDGELLNGWSIRNMNEPVEKQRNSLQVYVIKEYR